jgi:hypothetical protein
MRGAAERSLRAWTRQTYRRGTDDDLIQVAEPAHSRFDGVLRLPEATHGAALSVRKPRYGETIRRAQTAYARLAAPPGEEL